MMIKFSKYLVTALFLLILTGCVTEIKYVKLPESDQPKSTKHEIHGDHRVKVAMAEMVERVMVSTRLWINLRGTQGNAVNIDKINGKSVCAPENKSNVEYLQLTFNDQENIRENYGPFLNTFTNDKGEVIEITSMKNAKCDFIYISGK